MEIEKEAQLAISAVQLAGKEILSFYSNGKTYSLGALAQTPADVASHRILCDALASSGHPIISEEGEIPKNIPHGFCWIVDPLDGTRDFVSRTGDFCVMVGLLFNQKPVLGAIYSPCTQELYFGCILDGAKQAYLKKGDSKFPLCVSSKNSIESLRPILSRSRFSARDSEVLKNLGCSNPILIGSIGLKFASIANASSDAYWNFDGLGIWDICAPYALLSASGGVITDILGAPLEFGKPRLTSGILASNGIVHKNLAGEIAKMR